MRQNKGICMRRASGAGFLAAVWGHLPLSGLLAAQALEGSIIASFGFDFEAV